MSRIIVIKIGTAAIVGQDGLPETAVLQSITGQVIELQKQNYQVVIVSSGAVGIGKGQLKNVKLTDADELQKKQIMSSVGQPQLLRLWQRAGEETGLTMAQCLLTRRDFTNAEQEQEMQQLFTQMLEAKIVPIVNENDFLAPEELDFSDNDQLATFVAGMLKAKRLILLSNVNGLYDGNPNNVKSKIIHIVKDIRAVQGYVQEQKSEGGLGGMRSKLDAAKTMQKLKTPMHLANSRQPNVVLDIVAGKLAGTCFLPL